MEVPSDEPDTRYKVVLVGSQTTGKSSLAHTFVRGHFDPAIVSTVGSSFISTPVELTDGKVVALDVWDTSGQEVYKSLAKIYCRAANIGVIVFSLIDHGSFESAREWVASLRATAPEGIVIGIAGNKLDLANAADRQVSREDALAFAAEIGASYLETSALSGEGVAELFISLANLVPRSTMAPRRTMVKLDGPAGGSSSSGCSC